jgi:hypothetical protein
MDHGTGIRDRTDDCKKLFQKCGSSPVLGKLAWIQSGQADFNLWSFGLSADATGKSSLDFRVRYRPDIQEIICDLLDGLGESLNDCLEKGMCDLRFSRSNEYILITAHQLLPKLHQLFSWNLLAERTYPTYLKAMTNLTILSRNRPSISRLYWTNSPGYTLQFGDPGRNFDTTKLILDYGRR